MYPEEFDISDPFDQEEAKRLEPWEFTEEQDG